MTTEFESNEIFEPSVSTLHGFEGPEKRLEVDFKKNFNNAEGLRVFDKDQWQEVLNHAKCTIISHTKNDYFDSYVLSESSLFVYPYKIMVKTCGTTTLLKVLPKLMEYANLIDTEVEFVMYSRKNFMFPHKQPHEHSTWDKEVSFLNNIFEGNAYVLGPLTQDHWYLYLADYSENTRLVMPEKTIEVMMHNLDQDVMKSFYRKEETQDKDKYPGVAEIIPGSETDEFNFTPCGYSMNGLNREAYYTIHVTPEPHCSFVSFETNLSLNCYDVLVKNVLDIFKPGTFTVTFFTERPSTQPQPDNTFELHLDGYKLKHKTFSELESHCDITLCNFESEAYSATKKAKVPFSSAN